MIKDYIYIAVLVVEAIIFYQAGLKKGKNKQTKICHECLDEVYMQGYDAGASDQIGYEHLSGILHETITTAAAPIIAGEKSSKKKVAKKVAKKVIKKSK